MKNKLILGANAIIKGSSETYTERFLQKLGEKTFLSLWSYPNVQTPKNKSGNKSDELCDLLVVFEEHVLIFSDKDIAYKPHQDPGVAWRRWYREAVLKSAKQLYGAERRMRDYPNQLFLDKNCTRPLPIALPSTDVMKVHRIAVAHGASAACKQHTGGAGSLAVIPSIVGDAHLEPEFDNPLFAIGQINPEKGYVHVLDDITLPILLETLDTISDFVRYLERKETFILSGKLARADGEEELLAYYLLSTDGHGWHGFSGLESTSHLEKGLWQAFKASQQRRDQLLFNKVSYTWDYLIEIFSEHISTDTQHHSATQDFSVGEHNVRWLAKEPRVRRRALATALMGLYKLQDDENHQRTRWVGPSYPGDPYYVFVLLAPEPGQDEEEYRLLREKVLRFDIFGTKIKWPEAVHVVGIAANKKRGGSDSYDLLSVDFSNWTSEAQRDLEQEHNSFANPQPTFSRLVSPIYPDLLEDRQGLVVPKNQSRNRPCPCGSGLKFKHCCGKR